MVLLIQVQDSAKRRAAVVPTEPSPRSAPASPNPTSSPTSRSAPTPTAPSTALSISWQRDLDRALNMAKANHGKVVVDVYTDWCGWCKKMDQTIYTDPKVVALSDRHVFLKLNAEDGGQGERFARRMEVSGYPTTIILDENGRSLNAVAGYPRSVQQFVDLIENSR
ncbi:MAG: thioredoxin family protein [Acidobacteria bacterium]|nr:thioredoxin family protein [Acidobacteriota bacterium]